MKKSMIIMAVLIVALLAVQAAFAYEEDDQTIGGAYPGPSAMDRVLTFSGVYDFALESYNTNNIVKLVNVPAGMLPLYAVVAPVGLNQSITGLLYKYTTSWSSYGAENVHAETTDVAVVYHLNYPTWTAAATGMTNPVITSTASAIMVDTNGLVTNTAITVTSAATGIPNPTVAMTADYDVAQSATALDATSWGFRAWEASTNGVPTEGKLVISVVCVDVLPSARE